MTPISDSAAQPSALHGSPLLQVRNLSARFATARGTVHAVDDVSLDLRQGETLGVVGESGSGKSVLARSIMRLLDERAMSTGSVIFAGRELTTASPSEMRDLWGNEIAMVFQNPLTSLNPVMRVGRQVAEVLTRHRDLNNSQAREASIELLRSVGIPEPAKRWRSYPHELSGGMRQRICIASALACQPRLLLADEPTTALDVTIQRQILDLLSTLREETDMSVIIITHDLGVVASRTNRVMVMYGGRVVETGSTTTLFEHPRHPYTAALLAAIPRLDQAVHSRLVAIPGRPVDVINPKPGCRFVSRCERAQERCSREDPPIVESIGDPTHRHACFFPVGSPEGDNALRLNHEAGVTCVGLPVSRSLLQASV